MDVIDGDRHLDDTTLDLLARVESSPDLSGRIMNRLGYMRAVGSVTRRRRVHRAAARVGVFMLFIAVAIVALQARERTDQVRRPAELTVPAAMDRVGKGVNRHREGLGSLLRHIRAVPQEPAETPLGPPTEPETGQTDPSDLDEEVNQSGLLPYKWA